MGRRTFLKGVGATAVATAGLSHERGFAQNAEAIAPLVAGAVVAGSVGVGWALREFEVVGSDPPAEGLTADALHNQVYQAALSRESTNASTIVDNQNILDGVEHTAYTEAKVAAIEQMNAGASESEVLSAANSALDSYFVTVQSNMLDTWNEAVNELYTLYNSVTAHSELSQGSVFDSDGVVHMSENYTYGSLDPKATTTVDLVDGSSYELQQIVHKLSRDSGTTTETYDPVNDPATNASNLNIIVKSLDGESVTYLDNNTWTSLHADFTTAYTNVSDGISTWVSSVYADVQSGDIEIDELVTPRERAAMMSDGEGTSQAIADLIALNVPVDAEREATITIEDTGATLSGTFALTDSSDGPIESGTTYDPSTFSGDVYFTTDMSLVEGDWTAINTSVDGGTITITEEPYEGTAIEVTTAASETVSVPAADWTDNGDGTWSYDASGDLETAITNVDSARFHATAEETQYETLQLDGSFTVDKLMNKQSGEEVSTTSFSNSEPQNDSNYISQEEWDDLEQQNEELIQKYEDSQSNGGGLDLGQFDMFGLPGELVAAGAAALVAFGVLSN